MKNIFRNTLLFLTYILSTHIALASYLIPVNQKTQEILTKKTDIVVHDTFNNKNASIKIRKIKEIIQGFYIVYLKVDGSDQILFFNSSFQYAPIPFLASQGIDYTKYLPYNPKAEQSKFILINTKKLINKASVLSHLAYFKVNGHSVNSPTLYEFFDPNCIDCYYEFPSVEKIVKMGIFNMVFIPVNFVHPNSINKSATIVMNPNPFFTYQYDEKKFNTLKEEGGIPETRDIPSKIENKLHNNNNYLFNNGGFGTPSFMYIKDNKEYLTTRVMKTKQLLELYKKIK